jgi:hypothetical protein
MTNKEGDFRGLFLNSTVDSVLAVEGMDGLVIKNPDYLEYSRSITDNGNFYYELTFDFDEKGLYDITMDVYIKDTLNIEQSINRGHRLYNDFVKYFTEKYGNPTEKEENYSLWEFKAINGGNASEASVEDFTDNDGFGSINVTVSAIE